LEYVEDHSKITIDIIMLKTFVAPTPEADTRNAQDNLQAMEDLKDYYHQMRNVYYTVLRYPDINYRYLIEPSGSYPQAL